MVNYFFNLKDFDLDGESFYFDSVDGLDADAFNEVYNQFFDDFGLLQNGELHELLKNCQKENILQVGVFTTQKSNLVAVANLQIIKKMGIVDKNLSLLTYGQIDSVIVHRAYRNKGIGRSLIEKLCDIAKHNGCEYVSLYCNNYNVEFYTKCGFRHTSNFMRKSINEK